MFTENEQFVTLTEQGNFGLGIGYINDQKEKQQVKEQLNEVSKQDVNNIKKQNNYTFSNK